MSLFIDDFFEEAAMALRPQSKDIELENGYLIVDYVSLFSETQEL